MKQYLIENRPKFTLTLVLIFFISTLITAFAPGINSLIFLTTDNLDQPINWYRFLTYPFIVGGLIKFLHNSIVLILTGYLFENKTSRGGMIAICLISTILGGLVFIIYNHHNDITSGIISPSMISWGYIAAAIVCGIKFWRTLNLFEKIVLILSIISLPSLIAPDDIGIIFGQISVLAVVTLFVIGLKIFKKTNYC